jgi:glyoxylase-like metal-dependent hydrolase (beta-lactamase superfamily II)
MSTMANANPSTPGLSVPPIPPLVSGSPEEVARGVFVVPDHRIPLVPNVGVIVGDRAALVVETGIGPRNGAVVRRIAEELAGDRPLLLTLTHFHPEHGYGAQAFRDTTILYNRTQHEEFRDKAQAYLEMFRGLIIGEAAQELEGVEFVQPHVVYDGGADVDLGGKLVQLRSQGPAHSRGDQVVFVPAEGVLFTGDLVETRLFPIFPFFPPHDTDVDGGRWIGVLEELQHLEPRIVVPGHGELGDATLLGTVREYLSSLRTETRRLAAEGHDADTIVAILEPQLRARYPDWDQPEWIAFGVRAFLAE